MVTRSVIRITPAERESAVDSNYYSNLDVNQLQNKKQNDGFKYDTKDHIEEIIIQPGNVHGRCLCNATDDGGFCCDGHSCRYVSSHCKPNDGKKGEGEKAVDIHGYNSNTSKKRSLLLGDADNNGEKKRRKKRQKFIDLTDVPPKSPILKSGGGDGAASKYRGVALNKAMNKWQAQVMINREQYLIGYYHNEEEAAIDYARAVFKYDVLRQRRQKFIDVADVPPQPPILKSSSRGGDSSKYQGVTFHKVTKKWHAQISVDGKQYLIGSYDNEEEAAIDYARAVFKYDAGKAGVKRRQQGQKMIDLVDVTPQSPIKSNRRYDSSKEATKKRQAQTSAEGKHHLIGFYDDKEESDINYNNAVFNHNGGGVNNDERKKRQKFIDLNDVPKQSPILRIGNDDGRIKDGASKYQGVTFDKSKKKWKATITIDGKRHCIGMYENDEEAAIDYARAVFKYDAMIDLTEVPPQSPILRNGNDDGHIDDGASKYQGVFFNNATKKWQAQISFARKQHLIGNYDSEEVAAIDYARAIFKYIAGGVKGKRKKRQKFIDLTDVPPQSPILRRSGKKDGTSKYQGVAFDKMTNKWQAKISVDGNQHHIGRYENEEEAAIDYARAVFKYDAGKAEEGKGRLLGQKFIDLADIPLNSPILRSSNEDGTSTHQGVTVWV
jgi:hypothetical protein